MCTNNVVFVFGNNPRVTACGVPFTVNSKLNRGNPGLAPFPCVLLGFSALIASTYDLERAEPRRKINEVGHGRSDVAVPLHSDLSVTHVPTEYERLQVLRHQHNRDGMPLRGRGEESHDVPIGEAR